MVAQSKKVEKEAKRRGTGNARLMKKLARRMRRLSKRMKRLAKQLKGKQQSPRKQRSRKSQRNL